MEQVVVDRPRYVHRLTVTQLRGMLAAGILPEGQPVELIDGLLVDKDRSDQGGQPLTHGPKHASAVRRLMDLDAKVRPLGLHVRTQLPITISELLEPEPDAVVVVGEPRDYEGKHPDAGSVLLAIEVADSSLPYDRGAKREIYSAANIPTYWIVNLKDRVVEVYRDPDPTTADYRHTEKVALGEILNFASRGHTLTVPAEELLGF
jgi:hypothetical protein